MSRTLIQIHGHFCVGNPVSLVSVIVYTLAFLKNSKFLQTAPHLDFRHPWGTATSACCRQPQAPLPLRLQVLREADKVPLVVELLGRRLVVLAQAPRLRPPVVDVEQRRPRRQEGVQEGALALEDAQSDARQEPPQERQGQGEEVALEVHLEAEEGAVREAVAVEVLVVQEAAVEVRAQVEEPVREEQAVEEQKQEQEEEVEVVE